MQLAVTKTAGSAVNEKMNTVMQGFFFTYKAVRHFPHCSATPFAHNAV